MLLTTDPREVKPGAKRTSCCNPYLGANLGSPTCTRNAVIPSLRQRLALNPGDGSTEAHGDVHGNYNGPYESLGFVRRESKQRRSKSCLGQDDGGDGSGGATAENNHELDSIVDFEIPAVSAKLELLNQHGGKDIGRDNGKLG